MGSRVASKKTESNRFTLGIVGSGLEIGSATLR